MTKEEYCPPEIEIVSFDCEDVIQTSDTTTPRQPVPTTGISLY